MEASGVVMEEARIGAIELIDAVEDVLRSVTVHQVQVDSYAQAVSFVDQCLQLFWRTVSTLQIKLKKLN
jgi:hypothetical protein